MEDRRQRWEAAVRPFREAAEPLRGELDRLRGATAASFKQMAPLPSYTRRPPVALRIPVRPGLATVVRPCWSSTSEGWKLPDDDRITIEPTIDVPRGEESKQVIIVEMHVGPNGIFFSRLRSRFLGDFGPALAAVGPFLDDPLGSFARSQAPNCGICGRTLSDPRSREQGIGPECIEKIDLIAAIVAGQA
jgi:hypothetical protein